MKKYPTINYLFLCAVILFPLIFFPISHDLSMFVQGGRTIAGGGRMYVDFVDLKAPFIYYYYAVIDYFLGTPTTIVRLIDYVVQLLTALLIYKIADKYSDIPKAAGFTAIMYCVLYVTISVGNATQLESLLGLPLSGIILLQIKSRRTKLSLLLQGMLAGLMFSIKFTFAIILISIIIDSLTDGIKINRLAKEFLLIFAGFLVSSAVFAIPFADSQIREGYHEVLKYLSNYSRGSIISPANIRDKIKSVSSFLGDNFSVLSIILTSAGMYYLLICKSVNTKWIHILKFSSNLAILLFLTVVFEGKLFPYHYLRMYLPVSVIAGTGLAVILNDIKEGWKTRIVYKKLLVLSFGAFAVFLSPLPRLIKLEELPLAKYQSQEKYDNFFRYNDPDNFSNNTDQNKIISLMRRSLGNNDKVIVISPCSGAIYNRIDSRNVTCIPNSLFFLGKLAINEWRQKVINELDRYKFIIVQCNDRLAYMLDEDVSSWQLLKRDYFIYNYIINNFNLTIDMSNYKVFQRKQFTMALK